MVGPTAKHTFCITEDVYLCNPAVVLSRLRYEDGTFVAHYAGWGSSGERYERIADELQDPSVSLINCSFDNVYQAISTACHTVCIGSDLLK